MPALPFADAGFGLALCSRLLFLYSDHLSPDAHVAALRELLRVAREVRVFPLLTLAGEPSPNLAPVREALYQDRHSVEALKVPYRFQRGGDVMLRLQRS